MHIIAFRRSTTTGLIIFLLASLLLPLSTEAAEREHGPREVMERDRNITPRQTREERYRDHLCQVFVTRPYLTPPPDCSTEEPEPEQEAPSLNFLADPTSVAVNGTSTLSWNSENATSCEASNGWNGTQATSGTAVVTITATTTYSLTCLSEGGEVVASVVVEAIQPTPEPEPELPPIIHISEVMYDLASGGAQGSEVSGANEWVELYNPTNSPIDLMGWEIGDGSSNDIIADTSLVLPAGGFLVITNATTTANFWDFSDVTVVYLGSSISGGLANTGDYVALFNEADELVDDVSYGSNLTAFDLPAPDVSAGQSVARIDPAIDTDTGADWERNETPTPGS